jgi:hypothetical protein
MEKEDPDNIPNSADKDYGFPFIKVEPLHNPVQNEETLNFHAEEKERNAEEKEAFTEIQAEPTPIKFESPEIPSRNRKSHVPLLFSLVLLILIILGSMAYFLYFLPGKEIESNPAVSEEINEEPQIQPEVEIEEPEEAVVDSITLQATETLPAAVPPPSAASTGGNLIVVDSKEDIRYYHLVVASLPNERIAREEAQVFLDKGKDIYLIFPTGDTRNYRLSVGKYSSFKAASEALPTAKADFNESTWILKY